MLLSFNFVIILLSYLFKGRDVDDVILFRNMLG